MPTRVRSFSKINLGLAVGPGRTDGYHGLATIYQTLALHDLVTITARRAPATRLSLVSNHRGVPHDARNTAWKMVAGALDRLALTAEVHITIDKRLPVQGGLGAGSANAAAALLGLERELGLALPGPDRLALAASVGSDVPLFLLGGTVLGLGRGEEVYPLPDSPPLACVVAVPDVGVSTALAFRELDARMAALAGETGPEALTSGHPVDKLKELSRVFASVWLTSGAEPGPSGIAPSAPSDHRGDLAENPLLALVRTGIENDFEEVAFSQHPSLRQIKRDLQGNDPARGALYACLSGSGSALFGLYATQADALAAQHRLGKAGTRSLLTETLPRSRYGQTVFELQMA